MIQKHRFENPFPDIIREIFKNEYEFADTFDNRHTLFYTNLISQEEINYHTTIHDWNKDRNSIFIQKFHKYVDRHSEFNETYIKFIKTYIKPLFPDETYIAIQKTPNIRFSLPNSTAIGRDPQDPANIVGLHNDSMFGHNENEMNFIIPITPMFSTNSIYYEPFVDSKINPIEYENLILHTDEFLQAYLNKLKHCNQLNRTDKTRISFDIRVIPYSKYMDNLDFFTDTKFELGKYYIIV